jgi:hypothetical protein
MRVERRLELRFNPDARKAGTPQNLSAIRLDGPCLWVAGDETATIERLTFKDGRYDDHRSFPLAEFVELPAGPDEEADIEGLARDGDWLWAVGSHSRKRKRIKSRQPEKARKRLATVVREENRHVLVRVPIVEGDDGLPIPVRADGDRTAAIFAGPGHNLSDLLKDDPHLAPFLALPGKDNGFDIEGVAAQGGAPSQAPSGEGRADRLYLGLRGPVLRGWAVLLEIRPVTHPERPSRLKLAPIDGERYRTHFLDLGGLGIRDLCPDGGDLLILAGPSMDLDGPVRVLRWRDPAGADAPVVIAADDLELLTELPYGHGVDHPEGLAVLPDLRPDPRLLVLYDSPSPDRHTEHGVHGDVIAPAPS